MNTLKLIKLSKRHKFALKFEAVERECSQREVLEGLIETLVAWENMATIDRVIEEHPELGLK